MGCWVALKTKYQADRKRDPPGARNFNFWYAAWGVLGWWDLNSKFPPKYSTIPYASIASKLACRASQQLLLWLALLLLMDLCVDPRPDIEFPSSATADCYEGLLGCQSSVKQVIITKKIKEHSE